MAARGPNRALVKRLRKLIESAGVSREIDPQAHAEGVAREVERARAHDKRG